MKDSIIIDRSIELSFLKASLMKDIIDNYLIRFINYWEMIWYVL